LLKCQEYNRYAPIWPLEDGLSLEIRAPEADALARELAKATGEDIDTAVVRALEERLARVPARQAADDDAIELLFERLAQLPVLDKRSPDEIIGYDSHGLPN
jgi:antitoxin VapB